MRPLCQDVAEGQQGGPEACEADVDCCARHAKLQGKHSAFSGAKNACVIDDSTCDALGSFAMSCLSADF